MLPIMTSFICLVALAWRQPRHLFGFKVKLSLVYYTRWRLHSLHFPFCWASSRKAVNTNFYSLWFDPTWNRTLVYRFSCKPSIHSTTDRFVTKVLIRKVSPKPSISFPRNCELKENNSNRFGNIVYFAAIRGRWYSAKVLTLWAHLS